MTEFQIIVYLHRYGSSIESVKPLWDHYCENKQCEVCETICKWFERTVRSAEDVPSETLAFLGYVLYVCEKETSKVLYFFNKAIYEALTFTELVKVMGLILEIDIGKEIERDLLCEVANRLEEFEIKSSEIWELSRVLMEQSLHPGVKRIIENRLDDFAHYA